MPILQSFVREEITCIQAIASGLGIRLLNADESRLNVHISEIQVYGWVLLTDTSAAQIVVRDGKDEMLYPVNVSRPDVVDSAHGESNECGFFFCHPLHESTSEIEILVRGSGQTILIASLLFEPARSSKSILGQNDFLFLGGDDSNSLVEHITGAIHMTASALSIHSSNTALINKLKCPSVVVVVPEAHILYREFLPEDIRISEDRPVNALLREFEGSIYYPLEFLLQKKADGVPIYTGHDSHWTEVAAHLTYSEIRKRLGRTTPMSRTYEPSILREARDLRISTQGAARQREQQIRSMSHGSWTSIFSVGILNHGNIAAFRNAKGSGKCLAFGTSFSTRLMTAYADDFEELVFCYGTTVDPLMVEMVDPDYVIIELPERFVHFPSLAVSGSTFMGCLIASHEKNYGGIPVDNIDIVEMSAADVVRAARNLILGKSSAEQLDTGLALVSKYSVEVTKKLAEISRLVCGISEPWLLRPAVAGMYQNHYVLEGILRMLDKGEIGRESSFLFPDSQMGMAIKARLRSELK